MENRFSPERQNSNLSRYDAIQCMRFEYGMQFMNSHDSDAKILQKVGSAYNAYMGMAIKPNPQTFYDRDGILQPEVLHGLNRFAENEVVTSKLAHLSSLLMQTFEDSVPVPLTDGFPQFNTRVREMFLPQDDIAVFKACMQGTMNGWDRILELMSHKELPLLRYSKKVRQHLVQHSIESDGSRIILPTKIDGVHAQYQYSEEMYDPYVSLVIEPVAA